MADNPIPYSAFISPDSSVTDLIAQLQKLSAEYTKMLEQVRANAIKAKEGLDKLNGANDEDQEAIKKTVKKVDELTRAQQNLTKAQSDTAKKVAELKMQQQQANNINKLTAKLNASKEGSYNRLSAQYSLNKLKLNAMSKAERKSTASGKALEAETKSLYEEMKKLQEATGKNQLNVGNYGDALGALPGPLGQATAGTKALGAQMLKLLKNPIVAVIALIAATFMALTAAMKRSEEGEDKLNKIMTVSASIFDNIMDVLTAIGVAMFNTLPNAFRLFSTVFSKTFNSLKIKILEVRKAWNEWTGDAEETEKISREIEALEKKTIEYAKTQDKLTAEIAAGWENAREKAAGFGDEIVEDIKKAKALADIQAKYNKDERKYIVENAKLAKKAAKERGDAERVKLLDADASIAAMKRSFEYDEKILANELKLAKTRQEIALKTSGLAEDRIEDKKAIAEAEAAVYNAETRFNELRRQRIRRLNMIRKEGLKQEKERLKAAVELLGLEQAGTIRANEAIIESTLTTLDQKIAALRDNAKREADLLKKAAKIELDELDKRKSLALISEKDYASQKLLIAAKLNDDVMQLGEKLESSTIKAIKKQLEADKKKQEAIKKAVHERYELGMSAIEDEADLRESEIDLVKETEAEKTRLRLEAEKARLKAILDLNKKADGEMTRAQLATVRNIIKKIDQELAKGKDFDLYESIGLKLDDKQKQVLDDSAQYAINWLQEITQKKIDLAQKAVDASQTEVEHAESALQREIEAREAGYAFNVSLAQRELAQAKQNEQKALEERRKAQRAQILLDGAMQASSMITATANVWKAMTGMGPLGIPLAIAATALMWGSFTASKMKALEATKIEYGDGGYELLSGGSHASGNDIGLGMSGNKQRRAEGGEGLAIFSRRSVQKYGSLIPSIVDQINAGRFTQNDFQTVIIDKMESNPELAEMNKNIRIMRANGERSRYVDAAGNIVEKYKNLKTIIHD